MGPAMSTEQIDDKTPRTPPLVPGVHNYCDRWCERCRFKTRCIVAVMHQRIDAARARGQEVSESDVLDELIPPYDGSPRPWLDEIVEAANRPPTEAEQRETERREHELEQRLEADTLLLDAREYGLMAERISSALIARLSGRGDAVVLSALEAIAWHALCISAKTYRAVSGELLDEIWDMEDDDPLQADHNGSAKIARLMAAESRECWAVLMQVGRAVADGVPMKMIERLDRLDRDLAIRFPRAMEFVRPGFDEEA
jgi:hypothetical protein